MPHRLLLTLLVPLLGLGASLSTAAPARAAEDWQSELSEFDRTRLQDYAAWRRRALDQALAPGAAAKRSDLAILRSLTEARALPIVRSSLVGRYRCRTIKVGGSLPLVVYRWFTCAISIRGTLLIFRKVNGSQRTTGRLYRRDRTSMVYVGASHYGYQKPGQYTLIEPSGRPNCNRYRNQVAVLNRIGAKRYTLNLPLPLCESDFDILELVRAR